MTISRRSFIRNTSIAGAGIALGGLSLPMKSYGRIMGANDRIHVAVMGTNSRGHYLTQKFIELGCTVDYVCDVDSRVVEKTSGMVNKMTGQMPKGEKDIRIVLEDKDVDIVVIATPDHWHAPASLMAMQAGKHVYVEKPCSFNPREGEMLIEVRDKHNRMIQMGNQQRSAPESIEAMELISEGAIGKPYYAKAWYANTRGSIGHGKPAPVPEWLDWGLFQGPAPREEFRDNLVHYNWHWFRTWGTGEINNNGTHEIDICRWALGVDYPVRVSSQGGRYHFDDDWEFYDTQLATFDFEGGKTINWEGRSCNGLPFYGRGRGASIHGTKGSIIIDRNGYELYDLSKNLVKEAKASTRSETTILVGAGGLDDFHIGNFLDGIRLGTPLNSPIEEGHKSVLLCHLGNIAQEREKTLETSPVNGRILNDKKAMKLWDREYEKGWEPEV